jgi:mannose-1-phosphate guanylyltransferase/mannose-6-phosphate isomerase
VTAATQLPVQPVILCGGSGTRLWPLSRAGFPKQFRCLTGDDGERSKAKRIQVNPKVSRRLQRHLHRFEHWIVVKGIAEIANGNKVIRLTENQFTNILLGETHRLANQGSIPLEIIQIQSSSYLGEEDVVRFEYNCGRSS